MKKLTAILLSISLILPAGTVSVLADPATDTLSAPVQENTDLDGSMESEADSEKGDETEVAPADASENFETDVSADAEISSKEESGNTDEPDSEELPTDETNEEITAESSEEEQSEEETVAAALAAQTFSVEDYVNEATSLGSLELQYDDRYDLSTISGFPSDNGPYTIFMKEEDRDEDITSYQVSKGVKSEEKDESLITQIEEGGTKVVASGVGKGDVYIIRTEDWETLKTLGVANYNVEKSDTEDLAPNQSDTQSSEEGTLDTTTSDEGVVDAVPLDEMASVAATADEGEAVATISDEDKITVYKISVKVDKAPLTLMFLTGQSNMEGSCSSSTGYELNASIACTDGTVYSTYMPSTDTRGKNITGLSFSEVAKDAPNFVAGSLQGAATSSSVSEDSEYSVGGTLVDPLNMEDGTLTYALNSLTASGKGKTGPDSGLAYEWNRQTGDKVWVINTAVGSSPISAWVSGGTDLTRSAAVWTQVLKTYKAETDAGHYTNGSVSGNKLVFWLQGETEDAKGSADKYESSFNSMYKAMCTDLGSNVPFGIIMVRAGYAQYSYATEKDIYMSGPRIAQYFFGSSNSSYRNVFVVSNVNEQWVTNSGVSSYFKSAYSGGLSYPMQGAPKSLPTKISEVHSDIHYSQVGHNENGITAADGMLKALAGGGSCSVNWKDENEKTITSVSLDMIDAVTVVPVVEPVYLAKNVSYSIKNKNVIDYDFSTGTLQGAGYGTSKIESKGGSGDLSVTVSGTDIVKINGVWTYTVDGKADYKYTGLAKNSNGWYYIKNGVLDRTYTGFAKNENGSWYITEGKLTRKDNSVLKDEKGAIGAKNEWYYVVGSKVQYDYTGLAKNSNGWWYIKNGKLDRSYTGFAKNENGSWYVESGKLTRKTNGVLNDKSGAIGSSSTWYYVLSSKVQSSFTGLADYKNASGWWYITKGKVDRSANTVAKNKNGWYYVKNGKVDKSYTGFATNSNGKWYVASGKVTKKVNGVYKDTKGTIGAKNTWYYVVGNRVRTDFTGLANYKNSSGWWYITKGKVDRSFTGIATNQNGTYYLKNGKVQKSYSGNVKVNGKTYKIQNGKVV